MRLLALLASCLALTASLAVAETPRPTDLVIDLKGRIYFTDPRYLGTEPRELEHRSVYRIDRDDTVIEVTHDAEKPNGIALSPDQKTLYVIDHNNGTDRIDPTGPPPT